MIFYLLIANGGNGHSGLDVPVETWKRQKQEGENEMKGIKEANAQDHQRKQNHATPIIVQNASGMNGVNGHHAVEVVDTGVHNFAEEVNLRKQETQNATALEILEQKEIVQSHFVAKKIWTSVAKTNLGAKG